jgi:hypothetical protein
VGFGEKVIRFFLPLSLKRVLHGVSQSFYCAFCEYE